jgi:gliding motility-associated-like protein
MKRYISAFIISFFTFVLVVVTNFSYAQNPKDLPDNVDTSECTVTPPANSFDIKLKWQSEHYTGENDPYCHGRATPIVADMNGDGLAEVVVPWAPLCDASHNHNGNSARRPNTFITKNLNVLNGKTGNLKYTIQTCDFSVHGQGIAVADVDNDGKCEIFIVAVGPRATASQQKYDGKYLYCYDGSKVNTGPDDYKWRSAETVDYSYIPFIADMDNNGIPEVVVGPHIYNAITGKLIVKGTMEDTGMGFGGPHNVHGSWQQSKIQELGEQYYMFAVADIDGDKKLEICAGNTIYKPTINNPLGTTGNKWEILRQCENALPYNDMYDGQTFVLDFDSDGDLDVCVLGRNKNITNFSGDVSHIGLYVWEGQTSEMIGYFICDPKVNSPSIPFAGDIDGDGYPEVIFNGWQFGVNYGGSIPNSKDQMHVYKYEQGYTQNDREKAMNIKAVFSRAETQEFNESAGFTVFDFNQDTKAEIVFRGETSLYILDGTTLTKLCDPVSVTSGTTAEYPVVADVDQDGHADIIVTEEYQVTYGPGGGVSVFESETPGAWGPARRVWNQWPYNVVNINEDMTVPQYLFDVSRKFPNNTRPFNAFLQQATMLNSDGDMFVPAADLEALPDETTFQNLCDRFVIKLKYTNRGSLMLHAPYSVTVFKDSDRGQIIRSAQKNQNMLVGDTAVITFTFTEAEINSYLPMDTIVVVVNNAGTGTAQNGGQQQECNLKNNYAKCPFDGIRSSEEIDQNIVICEGDTFIVGESAYTRSGNYIDTLKNKNGCDSIVKTHLTVSSISVDLGPDQRYCERALLGEPGYVPVTLDGGASATSYIWDDNSTDRYRTTPTSLAAGDYEYYVTVTNRDGCTASDTVIITIIHNPEITITKDPEDYCKDGQVTLIATADVDGVIWQWASGQSEDRITVTTEEVGPGMRVYVVGSNDGCKNSQTDTIAPCPCTVELFNAFTPNGDGINDEFAPKLDADFKYYQFIIYDRWGKSVFKSEDPEEKWDGTIHGQKAADGVYYYVFTYACMSAPDEKISKHGSITLIR